MSAEITYLEAIREALFEEMERDENVFCLGEDIGAFGGAFKVTEGLMAKFGESRVIDSPISEIAIVGAAAGAGHMGMRPVVEMQFIDFIANAYDMLTNYVATARYRAFLPCPMVVRGPSGGYVRGGPFHSQNPEAGFIHTPGLKVVYPATAEDAKGLMKAAIRDDDPVLFFEHKYLYRRIKGVMPVGDHVVPIGKARDRARRHRRLDHHVRRHRIQSIGSSRAVGRARHFGGGARFAHTRAAGRRSYRRHGQKNEPVVDCA